MSGSTPLSRKNLQDARGDFNTPYRCLFIGHALVRLECQLNRSFEELSELDLSALLGGEGRCAAGRLVRHDIGAHPADVVQVGGQERDDESGRAEVGVADDEARRGAKVGLVLLLDSWCRSFIAGILRPALPALMPSTRKSRRPPMTTLCVDCLTISFHLQQSAATEKEAEWKKWRRL